MTQTLQFLPDPRRALENLVAALKPGGTMLVTVPAISRVADETDRWRWTPHGLQDLTAGLGCAHRWRARVTCYQPGIPHGARHRGASDGGTTREDPAFPVIVTARLDKRVDSL